MLWCYIYAELIKFDIALQLQGKAEALMSANKYDAASTQILRPC